MSQMLQLENSPTISIERRSTATKAINHQARGDSWFSTVRNARTCRKQYMYAPVGHARVEMFSSIKYPSFLPFFPHAVLQLLNCFNTITLVYLGHSALPCKILPPIIASIFNILNKHHISISLLCLSVGIVLVVGSSKENSTIMSTERESFAALARSQSATLLPMQSGAMEAARVIWGIIGDEHLGNFVCD